MDSSREEKNLFKCTERKFSHLGSIKNQFVKELRVASSLSTRTDFIEEHEIYFSEV